MGCLAAMAGTLLLAIVSVPVTAQVAPLTSRPEGEFGFGVDNQGGHLQYAVGTDLHVGLNLNVGLRKECPECDQQTVYAIGPYAKLLFSSGALRPYVAADLAVVQHPAGYLNFSARNTPPLDYGPWAPDTIGPMLRANISVGGEYILDRNVGIYGQVALLTTELGDFPTYTAAGVKRGILGVEFFF